MNASAFKLYLANNHVAWAMLASKMLAFRFRKLFSKLCDVWRFYFCIRPLAKVELYFSGYAA